MKNATKLSWVVLGIGVAFVIFGLVTLAQQFFLSSQSGQAVLASPAVEALGAADTASEQPSAPTALEPDAKLASVDTSMAAAPMSKTDAKPDTKAAPKAAAQAAPPAAPVVPTVDVAAALKQYQTTFPIPDHIWIDKIKVDAKIQPVGPGKSVSGSAVEWSSPNNKNVGWHDYSGHLNEGKNIVLNGHNNIYGSVFRKLYTLKAGDEIRIGAGDKVVTYVVEQSMILAERGQPLSVRIQNAQYIQPMNDDRLTLISCWPETNNTHRVVVIARPVKSQ